MLEYRTIKYDSRSSQYGCLIKVLSGSLIEENYFKNQNKLEYNSRKIINENTVSFKKTNELHRIINNADKTISMHIYSPPKYIANVYFTISNNGNLI